MITRLTQGSPLPPVPALKRTEPAGPPDDPGIARNIEQYHRMLTMLKEIPEIRPDKVAEARAYLKERGTLAPGDANAVAEKILPDLLAGTEVSSETPAR